MFNIGTKEIVIIAAVIVLLFGSKKIPELTQGVADGIKHLRNAFKDEPTDLASSVSSAKKK